ncbi:hypothetical protein [Amycolatopsis suaedae]|uniref:hypothetical protein n=1 Tax=Amycolatopsis suaedae TaxID=2510978 RepID=UPI0013EF322C|nr:hypothetical protein [Amycolatopsis suaedae]
MNQQHPSYAVRKVKRETAHTFHLIMTLCTFGIWGIMVWMPLLLIRKMLPKRREVTRFH